MALNKEVTQVDREIFFDSPKRYLDFFLLHSLIAFLFTFLSILNLQPGEEVIRQYSRVEDTKGGSNEYGTLRISNLRVVWIYSGIESNNLCFFFSVILSHLVINSFYVDSNWI